jgi:WD40 repeat protein
LLNKFIIFLLDSLTQSPTASPSTRATRIHQNSYSPLLIAGIVVACVTSFVFCAFITYYNRYCKQLFSNYDLGPTQTRFTNNLQVQRPSASTHLGQNDPFGEDETIPAPLDPDIRNQFEEQNRLTDIRGCILCLTVSEDLRHLYSGADNGEIIVWNNNFNNISNIKTLTDHNNAVNCIVTNDVSLISGSNDFSVIIRIIAQNYAIIKILPFESRVISLAFNRKDRNEKFLFIRLFNDNIIKVWNFVDQNYCIDIPDTNERKKFRGILVFDNQKLISNSVQNDTAQYWDISIRINITPVLLHHSEQPVRRQMMAIAFRKNIFCAIFYCPDAPLTVVVWDITNDNLLLDAPAPNLEALQINCLAISNHNNDIFTG